MVCDKMVLDRWCVTKLCVKLLYVKDDKVVCEVIVCERWYVTKMGKRRREEEEEAGHPGYRIKNKNPTQSFGEKQPKTISHPLFFIVFHYFHFFLRS